MRRHLRNQTRKLLTRRRRNPQRKSKILLFLNQMKQEYLWILSKLSGKARAKSQQEQ
jgi:hypothetical protein